MVSTENLERLKALIIDVPLENYAVSTLPSFEGHICFIH